VIQNNGEKEILLLSLGTGIPKAQNKLGGIFDLGCQALWLSLHQDVFNEAMFRTDVTHYYLATIFPGLLPADNYLRIEVCIIRFFKYIFLYTYNIEENKMIIICNCRSITWIHPWKKWMMLLKRTWITLKRWERAC